MIPLLPPVPPWEGVHPALVHFPVALLAVSPLPALLALLHPGRRVLFTALTLAVVTLGALGAVFAVESGEAADHSMEARGLETPAVHDTLEHHEELAETTRTAAIVLMLILGGTLIGFRKDKVRGAAASALAVVLLAGTLTVALLVLNTGHHGGQLVHRYGIRAMVMPGDTPAEAARPPREREDDDD